MSQKDHCVSNMENKLERAKLEVEETDQETALLVQVQIRYESLN